MSRFKENKILNIIVFLVILIGMSVLVYFIYKNIDKIIEVVNPIDRSDKVAPTISDITIKSDNIYNDKYAEEGNGITLKFKVDEELKSTPKVIINDKEVEVYKRGEYYQAYYNVLTQSDKNITVKYEISSYEDRNGNKGKTISSDKNTVTIVSKGTIIKDIE